MRHSASLLASLEGLSHPAYLIATELSNNSRSGLTVRFLSKKLEMAEEEIEYLLDVNHRLIFTDLTKVKIVKEGQAAMKRIREGLENHGDIPSMYNRVKSLSPHEYRCLEERVGLDQPVTKKQAVDALLERHYLHPESLLTYVGTYDFSSTAREVFDVLCQSKDGVMPVSQIRVAHGGREHEVEAALTELFLGFALFEMFRFDSEDRLVRVAGLLKEVRQFQSGNGKKKKKKDTLKTLKEKAEYIQCRGLEFSDKICQLLSAMAARPVRLRGDGDLFKEDHRRLSDVCPEDEEPSLNTCLWAAEGVAWVGRVDNQLCVGELEALIQKDRIGRHQVLFEWFMQRGDDAYARALLVECLDDLKVGQWYATHELIEWMVAKNGDHDQPVLKQSNGKWEYISPASSGQMETRLSRAFDEFFYWLGIFDRSMCEGDSAVRLTALGHGLLTASIPDALHKEFPERIGEIVVQPNFDVVVPTQEMDPLLTVPLDQFAIRASSGKASVYNVTKESFVQALQEGHDGNAFVNFLLQHNRGGSLPANVMQTLEDWRGGMKRVRVRTIKVIESEDPLVMADLIHRKRFQKYLIPLESRKMVAFAELSAKDLGKLLEKEGFIID